MLSNFITTETKPRTLTWYPKQGGNYFIYIFPTLKQTLNLHVEGFHLFAYHAFKKYFHLHKDVDKRSSEKRSSLSYIEEKHLHAP